VLELIVRALGDFGFAILDWQPAIPASFGGIVGHREYLDFRFWTAAGDSCVIRMHRRPSLAIS
jgi:hypothetical protein